MHDVIILLTTPVTIYSCSSFYILWNSRYTDLVIIIVIIVSWILTTEISLSLESVQEQFNFLFFLSRYNFIAIIILTPVYTD